VFLQHLYDIITAVSTFVIINDDDDEAENVMCLNHTHLVQESRVVKDELLNL